MKVGIYVRISSDPQGLRAGVQRQEEDCRTEADRRGWDVAGVWSDNDVSAYSGKARPQYKALMQAVETGKVGAILAYSPDRLSRAPRELEDLVDVVDRTGVRVVFCTAGEWSLETADGRAHARLLGVIARMEAEKMAERVKRAALQAAQAGKPSGGRAYGWESDGVTEREAEVEVVRGVYEAFLKGTSLSVIARALNEAGVPACKGGPWSYQALKQLVSGPRLVGLRTHNGTLYPAVWSGIVSQADWDTAQALLASQGARNRAGGNAGRRPRAFLLTGLVFCGVEGCGRKLIAGRDRKGVRRYVCESKARGGCGRVHISADRLEEWVRHEVKERGYGRKAPAGQMAKAQASIRTLEERIEALDHAHMVEGRFTDGHYLAMRVALEDKVRVGRRVSAEMPLEVAPTASEETLEGRRARVDQAVLRITVLPALRAGFKGLDPDRVRVKWRPKEAL